MNNVVLQKQQLRQDMLLKRKQLKSSYKHYYDLIIRTKLSQLIKKRDAQVIHAYLPMKNEINIMLLLKELIDEGKTIVCPQTLTKRRLKNLILNNISDIEVGLYNTLQPANAAEYHGPLDVIIVPGLAYDRKNYRLGYGSGYYDNFLIQYPNALKVGIFYPMQEVDSVPTEPHDFKLDDILVHKLDPNQTQNF